MTLIGAATLCLSFAAGTSPLLAGIAITALGAGFAIVVTVTTTAIGLILPPEQIGVGVGIFQGAQFLGAGAGPAVFASILATRHSIEQAPLNPLYTGEATSYSDTFLILTAAILVAIATALQPRPATPNR